MKYSTNRKYRDMKVLVTEIKTIKKIKQHKETTVKKFIDWFKFPNLYKILI